MPICTYTVHVGLAIWLKLSKDLEGFNELKLNVLVKNVESKTKDMLDKQLNDKERIISALENKSVFEFIESLIS